MVAHPRYRFVELVCLLEFRGSLRLRAQSSASSCTKTPYRGVRSGGGSDPDSPVGGRPGPFGHTVRTGLVTGSACPRVQGQSSYRHSGTRTTRRHSTSGRYLGRRPGRDGTALPSRLVFGPHRPSFRRGLDNSPAATDTRWRQDASCLPSPSVVAGLGDRRFPCVGPQSKAVEVPPLIKGSPTAFENVLRDLADLRGVQRTSAALHTPAVLPIAIERHD